LNINRDYEIGFIINPEAAEDEVKKVIDSVVEIVKNAGGSIENVDEWGRRKLAYAIRRHHEGIYIFITVAVSGPAIFDIERRLKLSEKVMRFVILRLDVRLAKSNRLTKKWKRIERLTRRVAAEEEDSPDEISDEKEDDHE
jgi:small subunit ribosomal protein S6